MILAHQPQKKPTDVPPPNFATGATKRRSKNSKLEAVATRDALPFFRKARGKATQSWWHVSPSGDYATDIQTGKDYARAFLPMLAYNSGAAALAAIVSEMAIAGRGTLNPKDWRGIDAIAMGFLFEIGGALQSAIAGISLAAFAIKENNSDIGPKFVELVESGAALRGMNRSTLFHDPNACIFSRSAK